MLGFNDATPLFVSLFEHPFKGPATEALAGAICRVCHIAVSATDDVWQCVSCGGVVHDSEPGTNAAGRNDFACLSLRFECPVCQQRPIRKEAGLVWVPEE